MHTQHQGLFGTIGTLWHNWRKCRATVAELGSYETARVARDVNVSTPELTTLAGKWPDAADFLSQRLAALQLDETAVARTEPQVLRDMERVCALCNEKPHCGHDLDRDPSNAEWRDYCPNVDTLDALEAERALRRLDRKHNR
ncbi:MAG: hypothetical protein E6G97_14435 [Alphaproteobacteria bacterium]|nr:MAG: hypothetical protein E6G97_14435 [Alphaproteobacteria bacterium]